MFKLLIIVLSIGSLVLCAIALFIYLLPLLVVAGPLIAVAIIVGVLIGVAPAELLIAWGILCLLAWAGWWVVKKQGDASSH